jgi:hypothetical protein
MICPHRVSLLWAAVCLLTLIIPTEAVRADDATPPVENNRTVPDVVAAFDALTHHGEWLGFRRSAETPVTVGPTAGKNSNQHFQGFARSPRIGRAPVLYLTHSGDPTMDLPYHETEGRLLVIRMESRNQVGERLRSNRLGRGEETQDTKPPIEDKVIDVINFDTGDLDYQHPGGIQMVGDILAVPLEGPNEDGMDESKVVFFDCSDPESPRLMDYEFVRPHKIGVIGITRLSDDHFLLVLGWGDGDALDFYRSNETSFFDEEGEESDTFAFGELPHTRIYRTRLEELEDEDCWRFGKGTPQTLNFVNQDNGKLFLVGSSNSSSTAPFFNGDDHMFLWQVTGFEEGGTIDLIGLRGKVHKWLSSEGDRVGNLTFDRQEANFQAAAGAYVSPTGELLYYGAAYYFYPHSTSSPPENNVERFAELRHVNVSHTGECGPQFRPDHLGGQHRIAEGSSLVIDGTVYVIEPWAHLFSKRYFLNSGVMVDWADTDLDDYDDFPKLDGAIGGVVDDCRTSDGFNDCMESFRWCGPVGSKLELFDDDHFHVGNTSYPALAGTGAVFSDDDLRPEDFDSEATSVRFDWNPPAETYVWTLDGDGGYLTPFVDGKKVTFHAGAGSSTNELHVTVWGETVSTTIEVYNVPPTIETIELSDLSPDEGEPVTLSGRWTDPAATEAVVSVEWGDGSPLDLDAQNGGQFTFGHVYGDNGAYVVIACVDDGEDQTCETLMVTVHNVAPEVSIDVVSDETGAVIGLDLPAALVGLRIDVWGSFTDPGVLDTHVAHMDWGDGSMDDDLGAVAVTTHATHAYLIPGTYTMTLTVIDDDQGVGVVTTQVEVIDARQSIIDLVEILSRMLDDPKISFEQARAVQRCIGDLVGYRRGRAANGALDMFSKCNLNAGLVKVRAAVEEMIAAEGAGQDMDLTSLKSRLTLAAKSATVMAIAAAEEATDNPGQLQHIRRARLRVEAGDEELAKGDHLAAIESYGEAIRGVQNLACTGSRPGGADNPSKKPKERKERGAGVRGSGSRHSN